MELFNRVLHSRLLVWFMLLDLYFECMFCRSLFVFLYFIFWTLCCLFFFDIRILITPFVSSNSSCNFVLDYKLQHSITFLEIRRLDLYWVICPFYFSLDTNLSWMYWNIQRQNVFNSKSMWTRSRLFQKLVVCTKLVFYGGFFLCVVVANFKL